MPDSLRPLADAMFASAAEVLGTLAGRTVAAGSAVGAAGESSIRVEPTTVATITRIPSAAVSFVARYAQHDLARVVELMLGAPGDGGELDAMQLSIVAETVAQISSAMGEALASATKHDANGITSEVVSEAHAFPAPPFATFTAALDLGVDIVNDVRALCRPGALACVAAHPQADFYRAVAGFAPINLVCRPMMEYLNRTPATIVTITKA